MFICLSVLCCAAERAGEDCTSVVYLAASFVDSEIITNQSPISRKIVSEYFYE